MPRQDTRDATPPSPPVHGCVPHGDGFEGRPLLPAVWALTETLLSCSNTHTHTQTSNQMMCQNNSGRPTGYPPKWWQGGSPKERLPLSQWKINAARAYFCLPTPGGWGCVSSHFQKKSINHFFLQSQLTNVGHSAVCNAFNFLAPLKHKSFPSAFSAGFFVLLPWRPP